MARKHAFALLLCINTNENRIVTAPASPFHDDKRDVKFDPLSDDG